MSRHTAFLRLAACWLACCGCLASVGCRPEAAPATRLTHVDSPGDLENDRTESPLGRSGNQPDVGSWHSKAYRIEGQAPGLRLVTRPLSPQPVRPASLPDKPQAGVTEVASDQLRLTFRRDAARASLGGGQLIWEVTTAEGQRFTARHDVMLVWNDSGYQLRGMINGLQLMPLPGQPQPGWQIQGELRATDIGGYPISPARLDVKLTEETAADSSDNLPESAEPTS